MAGPKTVGQVVRELRERQGMTIEVLAERASIARSLVVLIEAGHGPRPSRAVLQRIARILNVHVDKLSDQP